MPLIFAITGSIATDHLMRFGGKFTDSLVADKLDHVSLSFLVDDLQIRRGGVAANISFGMGKLGLRPILVGAVGTDFVDYRSWLERHGVDCESIYTSTQQHTARFVCTTDIAQNQIASFYPGAMSESAQIELGPILERLGTVDYVFVGPNDPAAMLRHTDEAKFRKIPFIADPSQQLARMEGPEIKKLIDGAAFLFTNEYESSLIKKKCGYTREDLVERVGTLITTLGAKGARVEQKDTATIEVVCPNEKEKVDPTGVGDAFRAGFMAGMSWGVGMEISAQIGSLLATYTIETVGTQEYAFETKEFLDRFAQTYGDENSEKLSKVFVSA
ncbi:MAG: carbohydrate kinase family protein [Candidatus Nanopelagicales bacterium]